MRSRRPNELYQLPDNGPSVIVRFLSLKEEISNLLLRDRKYDRRDLEKASPYFAFLRLREYPEDYISQNHGAPPLFSVLGRQYLAQKYLNR